MKKRFQTKIVNAISASLIMMAVTMSAQVQSSEGSFAPVVITQSSDYSTSGAFVSSGGIGQTSGYTHVSDYQVVSELADITQLSISGITVVPEGGVANAGETVTLTVSATGEGDLSYEWTLNDGAEILGTEAEYSFTASSETAGLYKVTVTDSANDSTASESVNIAVIVPPTITSISEDVTVNEGNSFELSVTAEGTETLNYAWMLNGTEISGANAATYSVAVAAAADAGSYTVTVSNEAGTTTSDAVTVTVEPDEQQSYPSALAGAEFVQSHANGLDEYTSSWFGTFYVPTGGAPTTWVYNQDLGWVSFHKGTQAGQAYYYSFNLLSWLYTNEQVYQWHYSYKTRSWILITSDDSGTSTAYGVDSKDGELVLVPIR